MISLNTPRNATDDRLKGCHVVSSQYPCGHWTTAARPVESTHVIQVSGPTPSPGLQLELQPGQVLTSHNLLLYDSECRW